MSTPHLFPDNVKRADRLQQLINHIGGLQSDIIKEKRRMDELDKAARAILDELLHKGDISTLEELKKKAMSKLTEEQRRTYQTIGETMFWAALVIGGPELAKLGGTAIMGLFKGASSMQAVQSSVSALVDTLVKATAGTAAAAGEGVAQAAQTALKSAEAGEGTVIAAEDTPEGAEVTKSIGFLGKYGKWFSRFGVVILVATPIVELFLGARQKERLIDGIHETQVARLVVDCLREQARKLTEQMTSIKTYLDMLKKGKKSEAAAFGKELLGTIRAANAGIDLESLEDGLEKSDKSSSNYYGEDDLKSATVVELALKKQDGEKS
ncbi:hypothetical protein PUNSTDRAFT_41942 [Punctularia strigosozonata HHB-11173 SS5]|uniref:uncharacterized protein n=1 Tax=Punctularia strigosozonata (strain HHB-11173) TaxID=741275 RepID=UPI0004416F24|nr:uncharacterized protein PUNSTDRAFT_41942 [Punctularia strigosozonata HHB-11173 SS5]EIN12227.1 hypothetical protein PUNSTDRAFT_41942 [Punctularia strigosozonata HHB-11173 SS5]